MPRDKDKPKKLYGAESVYIEPMNCSSTVSFRVYEDQYGRNAYVELADCSHKITWSFDIEDDGVTKVDNAIAALQKFRKHLTDAVRDEKRDQKEREKNNAVGKA